MSIGEVDHSDGCRCPHCRRRMVEEIGVMARMMKAVPTQEADGHFRGCPRLGKCSCPANAPRDPFFCEHSERPEACWPCKVKQEQKENP